MTAEQLVALIEANPTLAPYFQGEREKICPCCVKRVIEVSQEHPEVAQLLQKMIACDRRAAEIRAKMLEATRQLQTELSNNETAWRNAVNQLYHLRNAHRSGQANP